MPLYGLYKIYASNTLFAAGLVYSCNPETKTVNFHAYAHYLKK